MSFWTVELWELDGSSSVVAPAPFRTARCTWALEGPHALEVDLLPADIDAGDWLFGRRRVKLKDPAGDVRFHGWLERLSRGGPPSDVRFRASAVGLAGSLEDGLLHPAFTEEGAGQDLAWLVIENAQAQENNMWGFELGTAVGSASASVCRHYDEGYSVRQVIDDMAGLFEAGFDWEIDEAGAFNTWSPIRGTDRTETRLLEPSDCISFEVWGDFSEASTYVSALGADGIVAVGVDTADNIDERYGRRESSIDFPHVSDPDELQDRANHQIRLLRSVRRGCRATWIEGRGPWAFGDVWLGDAVSIDEGVPFDLDGAGPYASFGFRLTTVTVTLDPGREAFISTEWERCWPEVEGLPPE